MSKFYINAFPLCRDIEAEAKILALSTDDSLLYLRAAFGLKGAHSHSNKYILELFFLLVLCSLPNISSSQC